MTLGIETATPVCSVGLSDGREILSVVTGRPGRQHAERLLPMVDAALRAAGLVQEDIEGLAVSAGPGSFTGLRIGLSTAKGIALSADLPLTLVSTLAGLAAGLVGTVHQRICPLLDARRGLVYTGIYRVDEGGIAKVGEDGAKTIDQVIEETVEPTIFLGEGALKFEERLRVVEHGSLAPRALCDPNGAAVAHLGALQIEAGMITDVEAAEPNYCRASQAERERVKDPDERG